MRTRPAEDTDEPSDNEDDYENWAHRWLGPTKPPLFCLAPHIARSARRCPASRAAPLCGSGSPKKGKRSMAVRLRSAAIRAELTEGIADTRNIRAGLQPRKRMVGPVVGRLERESDEH